MEHKIICPHCELPLLLPKDCGKETIACPGCRGVFPNPFPAEAGEFSWGALPSGGVRIDEGPPAYARRGGCGQVIVSLLVGFGGVVSLSAGFAGFITILYSEYAVAGWLLAGMTWLLLVSTILAYFHSGRFSLRRRPAEAIIFWTMLLTGGMVVGLIVFLLVLWPLRYFL